MNANRLMDLLYETTRIIKREVEQNFNNHHFINNNNNKNNKEIDYIYNYLDDNLFDSNENNENDIRFYDKLIRRNVNSILIDNSISHSRTISSIRTSSSSSTKSIIEKYLVRNDADDQHHHQQQQQQQDQNQQLNQQQLLFINDEFSLILLVIIVSLIFITIVISIMVYCCLKRRNSYKSAPNDLASLSLTNSISSSNHNKHNSSSLIGGTSGIITSSIDNLSINYNSISSSTTNINSTSSGIGSCSSSSSASTNSSNITNNNNNNSSNKQNIINNNNNNNSQLKEVVCVNLPIAKPSINETKPQLSIESKMKAKTLFESKSLFNKRRGSNNSLTLTINPVIKKKLPITSPSKECSTLEYLSKASRLLTINELIEISKENNNLYNEFYFIPFNHPETAVLSTGIKNRYKTIIPNEATRVKLPIRGSDPSSTYINANYIYGYKQESKAYIASQGPMSNTINDFWLMVWNESVSCIVMITKLIERNKNKCELYLPEMCSQPVSYDNIVVTVKQISYLQDYEVRQLTISCNNEIRIIYHYWYTAWPDHNLPENPNALIQLIKQVEATRKYDENMKKSGPVLVHCSAGVGRTGCFLALSIGIKQLDLENVVDVVQILCHLRKDRGGMIQTLEQYEFVYQVLAYYCIYYKKFPYIQTSSPAMSISSPSSTCLQSSTSSNFSFNINTQTIQ